jgi:hypothetical protein
VSTEPHPPSLDIIFSEVSRRLDVQLSQVDTLDAKAGTVISVASVVMTLGAGLPIASSNSGIDTVPLILLVAGAVVYVAVMFFGFRGYWLRNFRRDPEPGPLRDRYLFQPADITKRRIIANMVQSFETNTPLIESKVWNIKVAILLLAAQTMSLVVAFIVERA